MKHVVLDIETIANEEAMLQANYEPCLGEYPPWALLQIACVSMLIVERTGYQGRDFRVVTHSRAELSERAILQELEREIEDANQVLTYNGFGFDVPVLLLRAAKCGVEAHRTAALASRSHAGFHLDVLDMATAFGAAPRVKLAELSAGLGIPAKTEAVPGGVAALAAAGEWRQIARYCETDTVSTWLASELWQSSQSGAVAWERWAMLADWIRSHQPELEHLLPYAVVPPMNGGGRRLGSIRPHLVL